MTSAAASPKEYFAALPDDRKDAMKKLFDTIDSNLPDGFEPRMSYGMITWVVPHSKYPNGYHCDPKQALPFLSIASQKNFIAVYHMGIYSDPSLLEWFTTEYGKRVKGKLDMGKSCIRFKKPDQIPFELLGELATRMSPDQWIECYESILKKSKNAK